jgi:hypothetical protein
MAAKDKVKALVLDAEAAGYSGTDAVHFGDFPGVWTPGQPVAVSELGFDTDKDALAAVKTLGLPLREVSVEQGSAPMPERPNHAPFEAVEPEPTPVVEPDTKPEPEAAKDAE